MKKRKKEKKEKVIKAPRVQTIFCIVSLVFILGCFGFYGYRLVKYYRVYNPKGEKGEVLTNLSTAIISNSSLAYEGDGLYISNGNYLYKGHDVNNYLIYSNMVFRILKINADKTIDIVLDDYLNKLNWDTSYKPYEEAYINKYLNTKFVENLDTTTLEKTTVCEPKVTEISEASCNTPNTNNYVRLLGITDFLNTLTESGTYLTSENDFIWLYNQSEDEAWYSHGTSVSLADVTKMYQIKPVITLKNTTILTAGDGSIDNPYRVKETKKIGVGTYLDINDDIYIVYEVGEDYLKVESNKLIKNQIFDNSKNTYQDSSLKKYLEEIYLKEIKYQDLLKEVKFGALSSKVGILSVEDFKFNSSLKNYFLSTTLDNKVYLYNGSLVSSKVNTKRNVRPCLGLKKDLEIISGNGSKYAPFIVEA